MGKEGQHLKSIPCSYMTSMCGFELVNWSGKIEFSQGKLNLVREKSGNFVLLSLWEPSKRSRWNHFTFKSQHRHNLLYSLLEI